MNEIGPRMHLQILKIVLLVFSCFVTKVTFAEQPRDSEFSASQIEFFEKNIRPLLVDRCYKCHSSRANPLQGGLRLDSRKEILRGGDSGPAIVPNNPKASLLIAAVRYGDDDLQMPPKGKLRDDEIAALARWIDLGAPMPTTAPAIAKPGREIDFEEGRKFWSFQPVVQQPLPQIKNGNWPQSRIDAFVLAQMEQRGLAPSPLADRRTLIRRATFDLVGLPPSPDEVAAFVNDPSDDAYARLIDRLLASPQYGERWGRFWLDLARYTDVTASWLKSTGRAYLYRDWVVDKLNHDVPYDQFVKRQIATDLMPETGFDDLAALGFFGLSPTYWKELKLDKEVIKMVVAEEWEERIDTLGRTFLGLTVACARCHDHKFDPISSEDYYALAGVFASSRLIDRPMVAAEVVQQAKQAKDEINSIEKQIKELESKKPPTPTAQSEVKALRSRIKEIEQATPHLEIPIAHGLDDASIFVLAAGPHTTKIEYKPNEPRDVRVHIRGNPSKLGNLVSRRFLTVLSDEKPAPFQNGSGRLDLARAIFNDAAPLAARVIVNRVWLQHFGRGLVTTPSNFGRQGTPPTHPKLLDDLAARFVATARTSPNPSLANRGESAWSLKWLHREIMLSATYRQASRHDTKKAKTDPDNRWLWRMNRKRLEIESWRDAMLAVTGRLDLRIGGAPFDLTAPSATRRTIYGKVHRRDVNNMLRIFDFPDPTGHSPKREITTTPLQQLFVLNSEFMQLQATTLATRVRADTNITRDRVRRAYQLLFGSDPSDDQLQLAHRFLNHSADQQLSDKDWNEYLHVLLGSNAFAFVD